MLLIDDRSPPPAPPSGRPVWEPDPVACAWVLAAIAATVGCAVTAGFAAFVLVCVATACWAKALTRVLPYGEGLREHRQ